MPYSSKTDREMSYLRYYFRDTKSDLNIYVGQCDPYFMVQCLCLISR